MDYFPPQPPGPGMVAGLAVFVLGLVFFGWAFLMLLTPGEPQVEYTCNPEQPHLSVKECVR